MFLCAALIGYTLGATVATLYFAICSRRENKRILSSQQKADRAEQLLAFEKKVEKLRCEVRAFTISELDTISNEGRRSYIDICSEYKVRCLLQDDDY